MVANRDTAVGFSNTEHRVTMGSQSLSDGFTDTATSACNESDAGSVSQMHVLWLGICTTGGILKGELKA
jgi:hypothetical protein